MTHMYNRYAFQKTFSKQREEAFMYLEYNYSSLPPSGTEWSSMVNPSDNSRQALTAASLRAEMMSPIISMRTEYNILCVMEGQVSAGFLF